MSLKSWKNKETKIVINDQTIKAIPTYHPARYFYSGRSKKVKKDITEAFRFAQRILSVQEKKEKENKEKS
jgi:hypothetical protein